jgi:O-antigen/teichoic acid export membrane protein
MSVSQFLLSSLNIIFSMNLNQKILRGAGISFGGKFIGTVVKYFTQLALAFFLGAELFGVYAIGFSIYQFFETFSRMGLEIGAVRYTSLFSAQENVNKVKGVILEALGIPFLVGAIFGSLLYQMSGLIAESIFGEPSLRIVLRIFAIALPLGSSLATGSFATTGFQTTTVRSLVWELLFPLFNLIFIVLFCGLFFDLSGAVAAWLTANLLSLIILFYCVYRLFPEILDRAIQPQFNISEILTFSIPLSLSGVLWLMLIWSDTLMLGYFRASAEVGIYRAASQTALLMSLIVNSLSSIFSPIVANLLSTNNHDEVERIYLQTVRWSLFLTMPMFLSVCVSSPRVLAIFGQEFSAGWLALVLLSLGQLSRAGAGGVASNMLEMSGNQNLKVLGDLISVTLNIGLNLFLIPELGMVGAAIATGISIFTVNVIRVYQLNRVLGVRSFHRFYCELSVVGTLSAAIGLLVASQLPPTSLSVWSNLFSVLGISTIVVVAYCLILERTILPNEDRELIKRAVARVFSRGSSS